MAGMSTTVHLYADDAIEARQSNGRQWLAFGEAAIFADNADLERLKAAIDDVIAMRAPVAEAA